MENGGTFLAGMIIGFILGFAGVLVMLIALAMFRVRRRTLEILSAAKVGAGGENSIQTMRETVVAVIGNEKGEKKYVN